MDNNAMITVVSVHSPLIQFSSSGSYYTSYAISLKSNDPCFTHTYSQIRRRYSEFLHLRRLLKSHYPTVLPPVLPPKNYFHRFSDALIEERKIGLQTFLEKVLSTPVYLSDKSLHLFLQSSCSMNQIDEECVGDIPPPQLMDYKADFASLSDTSSIPSSYTSDQDASLKEKNNLTNVNLKNGNIVSHTTLKGRLCSPTELKSQSIPVLLGCNSMPRAIPKHAGSLDSSPSSSLSSSDTEYSSSLDYNRRKVSFNQNVTVAVVCNQLWNIGTTSIRSEA